MTDCLFCQIAKRQAPRERYPENIILFESDNFYVKPALGHFVEGYCLVISKEHLRTMAELSSKEAAELEEVLGETERQLTAIYKNGLCTFEHGAACSSNRAGACIDHAHMHILPTSCDVTARLAALESVRISELRELCDFANRGQSYIYYEPQPGERLVYACDDRVPSQFMRRLICKQLDTNRNWDWRVSPYREVIQKFVARWTNPAFEQAGSLEYIAS